MAKARKEIEEEKEIHRQKMQEKRLEWEAAQQKKADLEMEKFGNELELQLAQEQAQMDKELQVMQKLILLYLARAQCGHKCMMLSTKRVLITKFNRKFFKEKRARAEEADIQRRQELETELSEKLAKKSRAEQKEILREHEQKLAKIDEKRARDQEKMKNQIKQRLEAKRKNAIFEKGIFLI